MTCKTIQKETVTAHAQDTIPECLERLGKSMKILSRGGRHLYHESNPRHQNNRTTFCAVSIAGTETPTQQARRYSILPLIASKSSVSAKTSHLRLLAEARYCRGNNRSSNSYNVYNMGRAEDQNVPSICAALSINKTLNAYRVA
jgi:hypothetical protein